MVQVYLQPNNEMTWNSEKAKVVEVLNSNELENYTLEQLEAQIYYLTIYTELQKYYYRN